MKIDFKSKKTVITLFLAVPIIWLATWGILYLSIDNSENRGQFGDMFGSINALFSGWAFVGVIIAILMQKEELELQRKELKETRNEFKEQNKTLKQQRFENTFFSMLSLHNQIVESIAIGENSGREAIKIIYNNLFIEWGSVENIAAGQDIIKTYEKVYKKRQHILGHYFRNLYRIFVFIYESKIPNQLFYAKIVRAQLSDQELTLLFYNCYYYSNGKKFAKYAEEFDLFDNLSKEALLDEAHIKLLETVTSQ